MQLLRQCDVSEVRERWLQASPDDERHINSLIDPAVRMDFPSQAIWYLALIESNDIENIFLISIDDFALASSNSWRLAQTAEHLQKEKLDDKHASKVRNLAQARLDKFCPVLVATTLSGPFTIIDGNHRAIVRQQQNQIPGTECCLALHPDFARYAFATQANRWAPRKV